MNRILCISILRVASGHRVKLASCKSALKPRWFTLLSVLRQWSRCWSEKNMFKPKSLYQKDIFCAIRYIMFIHLLCGK